MTDTDTTDIVLRAYEITGPYTYLTYDEGIWNYGDCLDLTDAMAADLLTCHFMRWLKSQDGDFSLNECDPAEWPGSWEVCILYCNDTRLDVIVYGPDTLLTLAEAVVKIGEGK